MVAVEPFTTIYRRTTPRLLKTVSVPVVDEYNPAPGPKRRLFAFIHKRFVSPVKRKSPLIVSGTLVCKPSPKGNDTKRLLNVCGWLAIICERRPIYCTDEPNCTVPDNALIVAVPLSTKSLDIAKVELSPNVN